MKQFVLVKVQQIIKIYEPPSESFSQMPNHKKRWLGILPATLLYLLTFIQKIGFIFLV